MRKGMIYTTFALLSSSLLIMMALLPITSTVDIEPGEATRISEASFFHESVLEDMERSLGIATRRALTGSTNYVVQTGEPLVVPEKNVTSALVNGSISGLALNSTENASLDDWSNRVSSIAGRSGYSLSVELRDYSFNTSGFEARSSYSVFSRLQDPATLTSFNRTETANTTVSITGLEDTMLLLRSKGRYVAQYSRCGFNDPAEVLYTGDPYSDGVAHGRAEVQPSDASAVEDASEKIIVAEDIDSYGVAEVNNFAGAVSAQPNSSTGYTTEYVFDTGSISDIDQNMSLILNNDQVWRSGFRAMMNQSCYVPVDRGPGFFDRLANRLVSPEGSGIATLVKMSELPSELRKTDSAVGYVYFNETGYEGLNEIRGVSEEYSWFRLDDYHVDLWGLEELAY